MEEGAATAVVVMKGAVTMAVSLKSYISSLLVPPQNSDELPVHKVAQSLSGARVPPLDSWFPHPK